MLVECSQVLRIKYELQSCLFVCATSRNLSDIFEMSFHFGASRLQHRLFPNCKCLSIFANLNNELKLTWIPSIVVSRGAVRSAVSSYAAVRIVAGSRPVLVIAWEWHIGLVLLRGCSGALEYTTTNSCGSINKSLSLPLSLSLFWCSTFWFSSLDVIAQLEKKCNMSQKQFYCHYTIFMYKAHHWALYHMWFQNKSDLYDIHYTWNNKKKEQHIFMHWYYRSFQPSIIHVGDKCSITLNINLFLCLWIIIHRISVNSSSYVAYKLSYVLWTYHTNKLSRISCIPIISHGISVADFVQA